MLNDHTSKAQAVQRLSCSRLPANYLSP
uniref:Glycosyltransferase n=1 Tax=Rhizophora mucronata TaxID=61149 RepID=A0A2P2IQE4_RHIMU